MAPNRQDLLAQAQRAARKGDMVGAANHYRALVELEPDDPGLRQKLGDALARSEQCEEARAVFVGLADVYSAQGHGSRALAVLQRAARLGTPDTHLLGKLADLLASLGRPADAKEPVLQAVHLHRDAGNVAQALARIESIRTLLPKDVELRRVRVELLDDPSPDSALAHLDLALAYYRNGQTEQAVDALHTAIEHDPTELAAFSLPRELVRLLARHGSDSLACWPKPGQGRCAWGASVMRRIVGLAAREQAPPTCGLPHDDGPETPLAVVRAAHCLLEAGDEREAGKILLPVLRTLDDDADLRRVALEALTLYVSRNPDDQEAGTIMQDLSSKSLSQGKRGSDEGPRSRAEETHETGDIEGAQGGAGNTGKDPGPLPGPVRAASLEAQVLLDHGLFSQALAGLAALPARWREHPEVLRLEAEARTRAESATPAAGAARTTAPTPAQGRTADDAAADAQEDDLVVFMINEDDVLDSARDLVAEAAHAEEEVDTSETVDPLLEIVSRQSEAADRSETAPTEAEADLIDGRLDRLADELAVALPQDDRETQYQMAIGLAEMGLAEQALPILEELARSEGDRQSDAVCRMAALHLELGREDEALETARSLTEAEDAHGLHVVAMLEMLCGLYLSRGDKERAAEALARLTELEPDNSGIEKWQEEIRATKS